MLLGVRILPRAIFLEVLFVTALALAGVTGIVLILGTVLEAGKSGLDPVSLVRLLPYVVIPSLPYTIPVSLLFACTFVFGRMSGANEIVALKSSGVNALRLIQPVLLLAFALSGICHYLADQVIPRCQSRLRDAIVSDIERTLTAYLRQNHSLSAPGLPYEIYAEGVDGTRLTEPIIKRRRPEGGYDMVLQAREATLSVVTNPETLKSDMIIRLVDGVLTTGDNNAAYFKDRTERMPLPDSFKRGEYGTSEHSLAGLDAQAVRLIEETRHLRGRALLRATTAVLGGNVSVLGRDMAQMEAEIRMREQFAYRSACEKHQRLARSVAPIPFVLLGASLSILLRQREFLRGFFLCFLPIITVYWPSMVLATNVLREFESRQWGLLWLPPVLTCLLAVPFLRRVIRY